MVECSGLARHLNGLQQPAIQGGPDLPIAKVAQGALRERWPRCSETAEHHLHS